MTMHDNECKYSDEMSVDVHFDIEEDRMLFLEATKRLAANKGQPGTSMAEVMIEFGITEEDLDSIDDVEIS